MDINPTEPPIQNNKPRNRFVAFLLAVLFTGMGQIYNGQLKKGLLFFSIDITLPFEFGMIRTGTFFTGFMLVVVFDIGFKLYTIYDAVKTAGRLKSFTPKSYNTWYFHLLFIIGISTVVYFYDYTVVAGVKSFSVSSNAGEPTLQPGDRVIADLWAYHNAKPEYGDIAVFQKKDSLHPWIYRIVGLPNDRIAITDNFLTINGTKCAVRSLGATKSAGLDALEYEETLPNGHKHRILTFKAPNTIDKSNVPEFRIPNGSYFLMGDSRDNAMDSRYIGVIREEELVGKLSFVFWGKEKNRINVDLTNK